MISDWERRQADRFYADLMGPRPGSRSRRGTWTEEALDEGKDTDKDLNRDLRTGCVIFYDEDTLHFIEGWTRDTGSDDVYLINRGNFDPVRDDGRARSRQYDNFLRGTLRGDANVKRPEYVIEAHLHTAPLSPQTPGDWDDLMIARLIAAGRQMTIQGEQSQWKLFDKIYDKAMDAARNARPGQAPQEFVAYFVLDVPRATLRLQEATNVTMNGSEANAPLAMATVSGRRFPILPGNDAGLRVIATIHTHAFQESSSGTTAPTHRVGPTAVRGLSKVDIDSARTEGLVKYAIDERSLHRVDPQGRKCQNRRRKLKGNVLRDALRVFGGEPLLRAEACG